MEKTDRDKVLQILALVEYRLTEINPDEKGILGFFGAHRSEAALLKTIKYLCGEQRGIKQY